MFPGLDLLEVRVECIFKVQLNAWINAQNFYTFEQIKMSYIQWCMANGRQESIPREGNKLVQAVITQ